MSDLYGSIRMEDSPTQWSSTGSLTAAVISPGLTGTNSRRRKPRFGQKDLQPRSVIPTPIKTDFTLSNLIGCSYIPRYLLGKTQLVRMWRKVTGESVHFDIYIGRASYQGGWNLSGSKYVNPYDKLDTGTDMVASLNSYRAYVMDRDDLRNGLLSFYGKTLGCWCTDCLGSQDLPAPDSYSCHGQVLLEMMVIIMLSSGLMTFDGTVISTM